MDRGPDSRGVVDYILSLTRNYARISCIMGNHEGMLLDYLWGVNRNLYLANGGLTTLKAYRSEQYPGTPLFADDIPRDHMAFYTSLKPFIELEHHYLVHAGFRPGIPMARQTRADMMWIREPFISSTFDFGKKVVFGHTSFQEPLIMANKIGLDTGAAYGKRLTCLELPDETFYSVSG